MVRVIILLVFLFLVWVLYGSGFEKPRKIRICVIAVILCAIGIWLDGYDKRNISNLIDLNEVSICGLSAEHSYRSNFDLIACVKNSAAKGTITRLNLRVIATQCVDQQCNELQAVERNILVNIPPNTEVELEQNLSFDKVNPSANNVQWSIDVLETTAHR